MVVSSPAGAGGVAQQSHCLGRTLLDHGYIVVINITRDIGYISAKKTVTIKVDQSKLAMSTLVDVVKADNCR